MDDLIAFAKVQLEIAQRIMREKGDFAPILVFEGEKGFGLAAVPFYAEAKSAARTTMREMLSELGATRYAFIMEAWVGTKKTMPAAGYLPSEDQERQEAVVVSAADKSGEKVILTCFITREGGLGFGEPETMPPIGGGPLLELLDAPTVH